MGTGTINALSYSNEISPYLEKDLIGKTESIFSRAVNILIGGSSPNTLITILDKNMGNIVNGILVDLPHNTSFHDLGLKEGMDINKDDYLINIPDAKMLVSLKDASPWICSSKTLEYILPEEKIIENLQIVNNIIKTKNLTSGLSPLFDHQQSILDGRGNIHLPKLDNLCRSSFILLNDLMQNIKTDNLAKAKESLENLIGLGIGLTPSADDVLLSFIGVFFSLENYFKKTNYFDLIFEIIKYIGSIASIKTTLVSQIYLKAAAEGKLSEFLSDFIKALLTSCSSEEIKSYTDRILSVGSSSGKEIILGISLAIKLSLQLLDLKSNRRRGKIVHLPEFESSY